MKRHWVYWGSASHSETPRSFTFMKSHQENRNLYIDGGMSTGIYIGTVDSHRPVEGSESTGLWLSMELM